jgi:hypothetical protein
MLSETQLRLSLTCVIRKDQIGISPGRTSKVMPLLVHTRKFVLL